jgi:hypothetical protein
VVLNYNNKPKEKKGGKGGNATRINSCRGPSCHMMDAEVGTSINLLSLPHRRRREKSYDIYNKLFYMPIIDDSWEL